MLTADCMREAGFNYPIDQGAAATPRDKMYGLTVEEAQRSGYTSQSHILTIPEDDGAYLPAGDRGSHAFGAALFGPDDAPTVSVPVAMLGGVTGMSTQGCLAEARRQLFGTLEAALQQSMVLGNLQSRAERSSQTDPALIELNRQWSECMAKVGRVGYSDPGFAVARGRGAAGMKVSALAIGEAKQIAVQDATCQDSLNYTAQRDRIEDRYLTASCASSRARSRRRKKQHGPRSLGRGPSSPPIANSPTLTHTRRPDTHNNAGARHDGKE